MPSAFRSDLSASEVDQHLRESLRELRRAEENAVLWFAEIYRRKLYRDLGLSSIHQYAALRLGFGKSKTSQFIRLADSLQSLPRLQEAVSKQEISWSKAREVAKVATPATETAWIQEAKATTSRALEDCVRRTRREARTRRGPARNQEALALLPAVDVPAHHDPESVPADVHVRFSPEQYARYEALVEGFRKAGGKGSREEMFLAGLEQLVAAEQAPPGHCGKAGEQASAPSAQREPRYQVVVQLCERCEVATVATTRGPREIPRAELRAMLCDARIRGQRSAKGGRSRASIPPRLRRAALERDRYRCTVEGCGSAHFLDVHHCWPREHGGTDELVNLRTACSPCHMILHRMDGQDRESLHV